MALSNEVKKIIYKEKPKARFVRATQHEVRYIAIILNDTTDLFIEFNIPYNEIGDGVMHRDEPAQLLIRWGAVIDEKSQLDEGGKNAY